MSNAELSKTLRKELGQPSALSRVFGNGTSWKLISAIGLIVGVSLSVMAVVLISTQGSTSARSAAVNQLNGTCTCIGQRGYDGQAGIAGPTGPTGAKGEKGDQGPPGLAGQEGPTGTCSNDNPICMQGQKGESGATGPQGPRGVAGQIGATGPQGIQGIQGFKGAKGDIGPTGSSGPSGPIGTPGVCDCLNISLVELQDLQVNGTTNLVGTVTLQGTMDCPGGALAPSCFGLSTCPDFLPCDLRAKSLKIWSANSSDIPALQVGTELLDQGVAIVNFGYPTTARRIREFTVNANGTYSVAVENTDMLHRAFDGNIIFEAFGAIPQIGFASTGFINMTADLPIGVVSQQSIFLESQSASWQLSGITNRISSVASNHTFATTDFVVTRPSLLDWFRTQSSSTLQCLSGPPLTPITGFSMLFGTDLIMESGTALMSKESDGLVRMAGLKLCGTRIQTEGGLLTLQNDTATDTLDVQAVITNSQGSLPVTFSDGHGVKLVENTFLMADQIRSSRTDNILYIHTDELFNDPGPVFIGNLSQIVTFRGDVVINGELNGAGTCVGCASDERVKEHITNVHPQEDLDAILALPRRVKYKFTKEYQKVDSSVQDYVHHSWIAQELEKVIPRIVRKVNQTVAGVHMDDFRQVLSHHVVPHLVGALKAIHLKQESLERDVEWIKKKLSS